MELQLDISGGLKGEKLQEFLFSNADNVEEMTFIRNIDESEIQNLSLELKNESIVVMKMKREHKAKLKEMKAELTPHVNLVNEITQKLERGGEEVTERVYKMIDPQNNVVLYYDSHGKLVQHRPIKEKTAENQFKVFNAVANS